MNNTKVEDLQKTFEELAAQKADGKKVIAALEQADIADTSVLFQLITKLRDEKQAILQTDSDLFQSFTEYVDEIDNTLNLLKAPKGFSDDGNVQELNECIKGIKDLYTRAVDADIIEEKVAEIAPKGTTMIYADGEYVEPPKADTKVQKDLIKKETISIDKHFQEKPVPKEIDPLGAFKRFKVLSISSTYSVKD